MGTFKNQTIHFNQSGFTIVSVLVVAGVLSFLALIGAQVSTDRIGRYQEVQTRQDQVDLFERIRLTTIGIDSCTGTFVGKILPPAGAAPVGSLTLGAETITTTTYGSTTVEQINLSTAAVLPNSFDAAGVDRVHRRALLEITGYRTVKNVRIPFAKNFVFDVLLGAGNQILTCYRGQNNEKVACEVMAGEGHFVNSPPTCNMPVQGPTQGSCPAGKCIYGFDASNNFLCRPI